MSIFSEEKSVCRGCSHERSNKKTNPVCQQCLQKGKADAFQRSSGGLGNLAKFGVAPSLPDKPSGRCKMQI